MRILPAVLADARRVTHDVAGVGLGMIERRCEQERQVVGFVYQEPLSGFHATPRALRIGGSRDHGPGLRQRIDSGFFARVGSEGRAVVEEASKIPLAIPGRTFKRSRELSCPFATGSGVDAISLFRYPRERLENGAEEPAEPYTFSAAIDAHQIHSIVPVA